MLRDWTQQTPPLPLISALYQDLRMDQDFCTKLLQGDLLILIKDTAAILAVEGKQKAKALEGIVPSSLGFRWGIAIVL